MGYSTAYKKASFLERLAAFIIDVIILAILQLALTIVLRLFNFQYKIFDLILFSLYDILFIWIAGATPGKMLLKLKVVNTSYKRVNLVQAFLRETIGRFISGILFTIGYLWMLIDKNKQTWHDKIATTLVVRLDKNGNLIPAGASETISKSRRAIIWLVIFLNPLSLATCFLIIYIFLFRPFQMTGESMYPAIQNKEYMATNIIGLKLSPPQRGEIIIFKAPTDPEKDYVKRVIGIPRDTVVLRDGFVYLNNTKLDESAYLGPDVRTYGGNFMNEATPVTVPPNEYLVLGDNRPFSSDSREWGFLPRKNIISKVAFCYWACPKK
jgi:signal peptidase I